MTEKTKNSANQKWKELLFLHDAQKKPGTWALDLNSFIKQKKQRKTGQNSTGSQTKYSVWDLEKFEITERDGIVVDANILVTLDKNRLYSELPKAAKRIFGSQTKCEISEGTYGETWCFFEFSRPGFGKAKREDALQQSGEFLPQGCGGFNYRLVVEGQNVRVALTDFFGIGYIPKSFVTAAKQMVIDSMGFAHKKQIPAEISIDHVSIHEFGFSIFSPPLALLGLALQEGIQKDKKSKPEKTDTVAGAKESFLQFSAEVLELKHGFSTSLLTEDDGWKIGHFDGEEIGRGLLAGKSFLPTEVLESREEIETFGNPDQLLREGNIKAVVKCISDGLETSPENLYLIRRAALLALTEDSPYSSYVDAAIEKEPNNLLFVSAAVKFATESDDKKAVLTLVSRLGAELAQRVGNIDSITCFDLILPEMLGDAWIDEERDKASACYLRILQRRGDLPRILYKLISISEIDSDIDAQIEYYLRLSKVERRGQDLSKIYLQLATLAAIIPNGSDDAVQYALRSLEYDSSQHRSGIEASKVLVQTGKQEEAIQLLDSVLRDGGAELSGDARSELELSIADVWQNHLGRNDLAEQRYRKALACGGLRIGPLKGLENIYRVTNQSEKLAAVLEEQFNECEKAGKGGTLTQVFSELKNIYKKESKNKKKLGELYLRYMEKVLISTDEIAEVITDLNFDVDWDSFHRLLAEQADLITDKTLRGQYSCLLSQISREKLKDVISSTEYLVDAMADGWIDSSNFSHLTEMLATQKDYSRLVGAYEKRIGQLSRDDGIPLQEALLVLPDGLSDARRDELSIGMYEKDSSKERYVHQRLQFYMNLDDIEAIARFADELLDRGTLTSFQRSEWLHKINEVLSDCIAEEKYDALNHNFKQLIDMGEDEISVLQSAITLLKGEKISKNLEFYVVRIIELGQLPDVAEKIVTKLLVGKSAALARYHRLMSFSAESDEKAATHARTAISLSSAMGGEQLNTEKMLGHLCMIAPVAQSDLDDLEGLVSESENWGLMTAALEKQAQYEGETDRKIDLLERCADLCIEKTFDVKKASQAIEGVLALDPAQNKYYLRLAEFAGQTGNAKQEKDYLKQFIETVREDKDVEALEASLSRYEELDGDTAEIESVVSDLFNRLHSEEKYELAGKVGSAMVACGFSQEKNCEKVFQVTLMNGEEEKAVVAWADGLGHISSRARTNGYIDKLIEFLETKNKSDLMPQFADEAYDLGRIGKLQKSTNKVMLNQFGEILIESEMYRERSQKFYQELYLLDPDDRKCWLPLYFLIGEFGSEKEKYEHLTDVLPKLKEKLSLFKPYPITIESLQQEFDELKQEFPDLPEEDEDSEKGDDSEDDGEGEGLTELDLFSGSEDETRTDLDGTQPPLPTFDPEEDSELVEIPEHSAPPEPFVAVEDESVCLPDLFGAKEESSFEVSDVAEENTEVVLALDDDEIAENAVSPDESSEVDNSLVIDGAGNRESRVDDLPSAEKMDWREAVKEARYEEGMLKDVLSKAFASELEKHIAIQAIALLSGRCGDLKEWHWRVWRESDGYGYPLAGMSRFPKGKTPKIMHSDLRKLLIAVEKVLVHVYRGRFSISYLEGLLGLDSEKITEARRPLEWGESILAQAGFSGYAEKLKKRKYKIFNISGLREEVFFEGANRTFYVDEEHYLEQPPSQLFHRIMKIVWGVKLHYFVPVTLDVERDILPVIIELNELVTAKNVDKVVSLFGRKSEVAKAWDNVDHRQIKFLLEKTGIPTREKLSELVDAMNSHIYRVIIAETLDIIGVFESILGEDLLKDGALGPREIFNSTPDAKSLLDFVVSLKVS